MKAILLGAGNGLQLRPYTDQRPVCMVEIAGQPLISWQLQALTESGVDDVLLVRGFGRSRIDAPVRVIDNPHWSTTGPLVSLRCARHELRGDIIIAHTDVVFGPELLRRVMTTAADIATVGDRQCVVMMKLTAGGADIVRRALTSDSTDDRRGLLDLVQKLSGEGHPVMPVAAHRAWARIDDVDDLERVRNRIEAGELVDAGILV